MSMKDHWLHVAFVAVILCWIQSDIGWIWLLIGSLWLYKLQKHAVIISISILIPLQLLILPSAIAKPDDQLIVEIKEIKQGYMIGTSENSSVLLYNIEGVSFHDIIEVEGTCTPIQGLKNFYQFDFSSYMKKRGISYGCQVTTYSILKESTSLRSRLYKHIIDQPDDIKNWLLMTLYGIKDRSMESSYMIQSSGMHISYLVQGIQKILLLWLPLSIAGGIALILMSGIGFLTTMKDSVLRILCFRSSAYIASSYSAQDKLGIGMITVLFIAPYMVDELSFTLPVIFRLIFMFNVANIHKRILSLLVLVPLQFYYFNELDVIQIILFPIFRIGYAIHYLFALLYLFTPFLPWYTVSSVMLEILQSLTNFKLPLYYHASFLFLSIWFYYAISYITQPKRKSAYMLGGMLLYTQIYPYIKPYMEVMMIDVGQGDCTLISLPFNRGTILLDVAGNKNKNIPKDVIVPVLHALGIRSIDLVIITHDDFDHSGGLPQLQELIEVKDVITKKQEEVEVNGVTLSFLLSDREYEDVNENSILTFMEQYQTKFLFMGDAGKEVEEQVLKEYPKLEVDVLKVGHHGSKTSSSPTFIHQLHPMIGLISCGANNFYGHPSPETIQTLTNENVYILDTPHHGAVSIKLTNFLRFYKTTAHEFGIIKNR